MDVHAHVQSVITDGYTIVPDVLDADDIAALRQALDPWLQRKHMGRNNFEGHDSERVYALLAKSEVFERVITNPVILPIVDGLLEPNYLLSAALAIKLHPGETEQPFHCDNSNLPATQRAAVQGVSTIWAIDDFTAENGATEIIPGSHRWEGERPAPDDERRQKILMKAGSVVVFHGSLYHRGGANRSGQPRLAITPQYCQPWLRQLENMPLAVPPEKAAALSERAQELLGYSIREPGFMGYVDGMHPKRLFNSSYLGRRARGLPS